MGVRIWTNKYGILYLDVRYGDGQRARPSTNLKDTPKHRKLLQDNVIPKIQLQILNGEYNPNARQEIVPQTLKDYGYKSLKRHKNKRREHVQRTYIQHFESKIIPYKVRRTRIQGKNGPPKKKASVRTVWAQLTILTTAKPLK